MSAYRVRAQRAAAFGSLAALALVVASCATTGAAGEGDKNLPTAGAGPFRKLTTTEVPGIAPFVFDDRVAIYREPAVIAQGSSTIMFAVARDKSGGDVIVRTRATDGRSFFGTSTDIGKTPPTVLAADALWEGRSVRGPFALRVGAELLLYYAADGGIGLARSTDDGFTFRKEPGPVFARDASVAWELTEVHAPSVYVLPDGRFRLLYTSGVAIGEAESTDGVHFRRLDADPSTPELDAVLGPGLPAPAGSLLPNERPPFDTARVADPCATTRITAAGRLHIRVLYTGYDEAGASTIGFAARYGETGRLSRNLAPVYSVGAHESAPAILAAADGSDTAFLYVQQDRRVDERLTYTAVAAAYAPATDNLPAPASFPDGP